LTVLPIEKQFPVLDILRVMVLRPDGNAHYTSQSSMSLLYALDGADVIFQVH
jgi:hypothetical protein